MEVGSIITDWSSFGGVGHSALVVETNGEDYPRLDFQGVPLRLSSGKVVNGKSPISLSVPRWDRILERARILREGKFKDINHNRSQSNDMRILRNLFYLLAGVTTTYSNESRTMRTCSFSYLQAADPTGKLCRLFSYFALDGKGIKQRSEFLLNRIRALQITNLQEIIGYSNQQPDQSASSLTWLGCVFCSRITVFLLQVVLYLFINRGTCIVNNFEKAAIQFVYEVLPLSAQTCAPKVILRGLKTSEYWKTLDKIKLKAVKGVKPNQIIIKTRKPEHTEARDLETNADDIAESSTILPSKNVLSSVFFANRTFCNEVYSRRNECPSSICKIKDKGTTKVCTPKNWF